MIKIDSSNVTEYLQKTEVADYKYSEENYFIEKELKTYFDEMIIENLLTNDKIVDFFDKNEFGLVDNIIIKKDVIDENSFYGTIKSNKTLQVQIANEFKSAFLDILNEADINFDIENYVIITVLIEEKKGIRIYTTKFQYFRNIVFELFEEEYQKEMEEKRLEEEERQKIEEQKRLEEEAILKLKKEKQNKLIKISIGVSILLLILIGTLILSFNK